MAEEMMNQQMAGGVMAPPSENMSDMGGMNQNTMETPQDMSAKVEDAMEQGRQILMQRAEQLSVEEKGILSTSMTPEFKQIVTKVFGPAVNDFISILEAGLPEQESAPTPPEPMVAQGEGMMMNRPPVEETAPAQV